ncbi:MAG: hypothetical protein JW809_06885 [Pirellulales bacterium]|nr:hypothetical protein [Pirellulales bacterium]
MLVVLGVISLLIALAWPSLRAPWGKTRLEDAANQLRITLAKTRIRAIESGRAWVFRFQTGSGRFHAAPLSTEADDSSATATTGEEDVPEEEPLDGQLPHGVRFLDPDAVDELFPGEETLPATDVASDPSAWSETNVSLVAASAADDGPRPILFFPNGRCTSARLRLVGVDNRMVDVTLRGLVGIARIGKPWQPEPTDAGLVAPEPKP